MEWRKAGRPKKNNEPQDEKPQEDKPQWLEQEWTKEELSIIIAAENSSVVMLGIAVVKQWIRDGKPKADYDGIKVWLGIINESLKNKNTKYERDFIKNLMTNSKFNYM